VRGRRIWQRDDVDVFLQVAMPAGESTAKADLSGAVIRRADRLRVEDVARQLRDKAAAVREKRDGDMAKTRGLLFSLPGPAVKLGLALIDLVQYGLNVSLPGVPRDPFGSVMVSSVGMLGINLAFAPIVTFSHCPSVVLVGQIEDRPVVRDGCVVVRPMCSITATFDHRVFDGLQGGRMVGMLRTCLEAPDLLDRDPLDPDLA
jgi:pyruvate dehydrogenase E2 component (dihydrolipoamide acetyltransferase)